MKAFLNIIKDKLGINKAIAFTTVARAVQAVGSLVTVFLVAKFMTKEEQGYYYTFNSILSIQIFVELGLGGIITQYVAHEFAFLRINSNNQIEGDNFHFSRLTSLTRFFARWYIIAAILLLVILSIVGFCFFHNYSTNETIEWRLPWLILIIATSLNLLLSPLFAFFEGINKVSDVAFIRMVTQMSSLICIWTILFFGGKLYAASFTSVMNILVNVFLVFNYKGLIKNLQSVLNNASSGRIDYFKEIFPYQWRIALSWMSGYFIFQLFNPVLFAACGPEIAGKMGMTLAVLNGILNLTLSWTTTNVPFWSSMIATRKYEELDISFNKVLKSSSLVCLLGLIVFILGLYLLEICGIPLYDRFLPLYLSAILSSTIFFNNIINAWATYLRCHKKEPFLLQAAVVGACSAISTFLTAKFVGVQGVVIGYASIVLFISLPLSYYIYTSKKILYNV